MKVLHVLPGLLVVLMACSGQGDRAASAGQAQRIAALETRVAQLETRLAAVQQAVQTQETPGAGQQAAARAAAQYCATQLASTLEQYRQDNARFPAIKAVSLPSPCDGFRVEWQRLERAHYRFRVSGEDGTVLAGETR